MKRTVLIFIIAALVLITCGFWFFNSRGNIGLRDVLELAVIITLVGFAVFIGYKRIVSSKRGEPAEDELSKKILVKASSISYYVSIYLWLFIMYFSDRIKMETHTIIGAGILGMALIFALSWVVINFKGIRNE